MTSTTLGLDPGPRESAYCRLNRGKPDLFGKVANEELRVLLMGPLTAGAEVVIETIFPRGQAVGLETMDTQLWAGRYAEICQQMHRPWHKIDRQDVRFAICGSLNTNDASVRQALIDRFGGQDALNRGGRCKACNDGRTWVHRPCMECGETGEVPSKRWGENKKCPRCKGACIYRERVNCSTCNGTRIGEPPGVLARIKEDMWSALAIACAFELRKHYAVRTPLEPAPAGVE